LAPAICDGLFATIRDFADRDRLCVAASGSRMRSQRQSPYSDGERGQVSRLGDPPIVKGDVRAYRYGTAITRVHYLIVSDRLTSRSAEKLG
jgi:hypothetical protein